MATNCFCLKLIFGFLGNNLKKTPCFPYLRKRVEFNVRINNVLLKAQSLQYGSFEIHTYSALHIM